MPFASGIKDAVAALSGGNSRVEGLARDAEFRRLLQGRSAQELLNTRVSNASIANRKDTNQERALELIPNELIRALTGGQLGSAHHGAQLGRRQELQNSALGPAVEAALANAGLGEGGTPGVAPENGLSQDMINSLLSASTGNPLGATEVNVAAQHKKRMSLLDQQIAAAEALANQRNASATKTATGSTKPSLFKAITSDQRTRVGLAANLDLPEIPELNDDFFNNQDEVDEAKKAAEAESKRQKIAAQAEFRLWRAQKALENPRYGTDPEWATQQWELMKKGLLPPEPSVSGSGIITPEIMKRFSVPDTLPKPPANIIRAADGRLVPPNA